MNPINEFLNKIRKQNISVGVIGDCMLDEYFYVHVNRISPEFPIPVMRSENMSCTVCPGGAANTARQFKYFNTAAYLVGLINPEAKEAYKDIKTDYCRVVDRVKVPKKRRFYHGDHPLCRWDIEDNYYGLGPEGLAYELNQINIPDFDVAIFSDYGKGFFSKDWFTSCLTIVDPKDCLFPCTILKPNAETAERLSGRENWKDQCKILQTKAKCESVVITQGGNGVVGLSNNQFFEYKPDKKEIARSVIGAGDCFTAFLAMAVGRNIPLPDAAHIAYEAGAIYVRNIHNEPITPSQLRSYANDKKIVNPEDLVNRGFKLVFTNGCFDVLHVGHLRTLEYARGKGDALVVALNDDESVGRLKPGRPVNSLKDRMRLLAGLECVDYVVSFSEGDPREVIEKIRPDVLVKGGDYRLEDVIGRDLVGEVYIAPMVEGYSTSLTLARMTF